MAADIPSADHQNNQRNIHVIKKLYGTLPNMTTNIPVMFDNQYQSLPAGKYIVLLGVKNKQYKLGYGGIRLGPITDVLKISSNVDQSIDDVAEMISLENIDSTASRFAVINDLFYAKLNCNLLLQYILMSEQQILNDRIHYLYNTILELSHAANSNDIDALLTEDSYLITLSPSIEWGIPYSGKMC